MFSLHLNCQPLQLCSLSVEIQLSTDVGKPCSDLVLSACSAYPYSEASLRRAHALEALGQKKDATDAFAELRLRLPGDPTIAESLNRQGRTLVHFTAEPEPLCH